MWDRVASLAMTAVQLRSARRLLRFARNVRFSRRCLDCERSEAIPAIQTSALNVIASEAKRSISISEFRMEIAPPNEASRFTFYQSSSNAIHPSQHCDTTLLFLVSKEEFKSKILIQKS